MNARSIMVRLTVNTRSRTIERHLGTVNCEEFDGVEEHDAAAQGRSRKLPVRCDLSHGRMRHRAPGASAGSEHTP
jgi:hypothetical protein